MTKTDRSTRQRTISAALPIALTLRGSEIPRSSGRPPRELDLTDLLFLERAAAGPTDLDGLIAEVTAMTGASDEGLRELVDYLQDEDLLQAVAPEPDLIRWTPVPPEAAGVTVTPDDDAILTIGTPVLAILDERGFNLFDHDGHALVSLGAIEFMAASAYRIGLPRATAFGAHRDACGELALDEQTFASLTDHLLEGGLMDISAKEDAQQFQTRSREKMKEALVSQARVRRAVNEQVAAHWAEEDARREKTGVTRASVFPVHSDREKGIPLALGLVVSYALAYNEGALNEHFTFVPRWITDEATLRQDAAEPGIFLFSDYVWNREENLRLSAIVKAQNPRNLVVHGGPSAPKYEEDNRQFYVDNPAIDVTVRGEGEATFAAMLEALADQTPEAGYDLSVLRSVEGLSFRLGGEVVRTPDRDRIADLDTIPSPYLTGLFEAFTEGQRFWPVIETNRGCPYGCTFCDWGSATLSRIRKFDLDRVMAELEWCSDNRAQIAAIADANFGIFARDVEIAEKIATLKKTNGFPRTVGTNYAKNTVKHLRRIIEIFADGGIVAEGKVSLQSMDEQTLDVIRRSNIKLEKYNDISTEFRKSGLPLGVDLMLGLPGSTAKSFREDLQQVTDRDVSVLIHLTQLLPNSPMNEPSYRREHGITARPHEYITETNTFTRDEYEDMQRLARVYKLADTFGVARWVAKFVRRETGVHEVAFYERLAKDAVGNRDQWPVLAVTFESIPELMVPPGSWKLYIEELRRYLVEVMGVSDDSALQTALTVQHAHLPSPGRTFPIELELAHDFAAWHARVLELREQGQRATWEKEAPRLADLPPGTLRIDDPAGVCVNCIGQGMEFLQLRVEAWELDSPVARPRNKPVDDATAVGS